MTVRRQANSSLPPFCFDDMLTWSVRFACMSMPYERFEAWRASYRLAMQVYELTREFPKHELYGLVSQARRAAFSVIANIAEGSAKRGDGEFGRFLDIAIGSLSELACALSLSRDLGLVSPEDWSRVDKMRDEAGKLTWGLYRSVRKQRRTAR